METSDQTILRTDPAYPVLLGEIYDPPDQLFFRGTLQETPGAILAVVGSRKATKYGLEVVHYLVEPLARAGVVIVSGLAFGIDRAAHEAALTASGTTWAVLGTPLEQIYPATHRGLARQIVADGGALLSESPAGTPVHRGSFPRRNRIIAGLAQGVLVVEASEESGSLITARLALEGGRDVYVVPGPIFSPVSKGVHRLLKDGATPVTEPQDLLDALVIADRTTLTPQELFVPEAVLRIISAIPFDQPIHIDKLSASATLDLANLLEDLTRLELDGYIRTTQPGYYLRVK